MPGTVDNGAVAALLLIGGALYIAAVLLIGLASRKRSSDEAGYYLAGRDLGTAASTATLAATTIGASSTIVVIGLVYSRGLAGIWMELAGGLGLILLGVFLAKRVRALGLFTLPEIAGEFYGSAVGGIAALLVLIAEIGWLALMLKSCQVLLMPVFAGPPFPIAITLGGALTLYTMLGGQHAVARTDVFQVLLLVVGVCIVAAPIIAGAADWSSLPPGHWSFPMGAGFPPEQLLPLVLIYGLPHVVGSDIYGKLLSARDGRTARRAACLSGAIKILLGVVTACIGLAAAAILPRGLPVGDVLPNLIVSTLPPWAAALALLAILAALMSSADSILLTAATVLCRDLLRNRALASARLATAAVGCLGIAMASLFSQLMDIFLFAYTLFSAGLTLPILFGFWRRRLALTSAGAAAAMAGGGAAVALGAASGLPAVWIVPSGLIMSCVLLFGVSRIR